MQLRILGMARSDDPLLDFVDALFASPHFEKPVLHQERRDTTGELRFQLDVVYLLAPPEAKTEEPPVDATSAPEMVLGDAGGARPEAGVPTDAGPGS
ncbi:MAG: PilN domain-containing protein, partial [Thermoanaerobaculia bacterium]|nr:PilN domain-containing protein [Thermoanaerobaculia bacterium]